MTKEQVIKNFMIFILNNSNSEEDIVDGCGLIYWGEVRCFIYHIKEKKWGPSYFLLCYLRCLFDGDIVKFLYEWTDNNYEFLEKIYNKKS